MVDIEVKLQNQKEPPRSYLLKFAEHSDVYLELLNAINRLKTTEDLGTFELFFVDSSNRHIPIGSSKDLSKAIHESKFKPAQILVQFGKVKDAKPHSTTYDYSSTMNDNDSYDKKKLTNDAEHTKHVGVVCDNCNSEIYGIRYKCVVCDDYDLCQACDSKGIHLFHNMLRIVRPEPKQPFVFPWLRDPWRSAKSEKVQENNSAPKYRYCPTCGD